MQENFLFWWEGKEATGLKCYVTPSIYIIRQGIEASKFKTTPYKLEWITLSCSFRTNDSSAKSLGQHGWSRYLAHIMDGHVTSRPSLPHSWCLSSYNTNITFSPILLFESIAQWCEHSPRKEKYERNLINDSFPFLKKVCLREACRVQESPQK